MFFFNRLWQILYAHGARKFVFAGLGLIGCAPSQRVKNQTEECNEEVNYWSAKYNEALKSALQELKSELKGMAYSYFETYTVMQDIIQNPAARGKDLKKLLSRLFPILQTINATKRLNFSLLLDLGALLTSL